MHLPILLLSGKAGSGKDTVASMIADLYPNTTTLAFADPMKRIAKVLYGFTDYQLWGPSEARNAVDTVHGPIFDIDKDYVPLFDIFSQLQLRALESAMEGLLRWYGRLNADFAANKKVFSPRVVLQQMGTEWGRAIDKNIWVHAAENVSAKLLEGGYVYSREGGLVKKEGASANLVLITDGRFRNEILEANKTGAVTIRVVREDRRNVGNHASELEQDQIPNYWFDYLLENFAGLDALRSSVKRTMDSITSESVVE